ncbi:MAG TPA: SDR family NAD(P)-dependent oxidoreductase [Bryobacteraceae bacterium]|jgi:3-oxoacyl-[acyl-carrier protein] reductase|nr:SDR family NAD(P)-dependent oxidoreductase [Bryobacteraceae bacterium]
MLLRNKVAVITGSATGIGQAIAGVFAENGASLVLLDRDAEGNRRTASDLQSRTRVLDVALDLRDRPAVDAAIEAAHSQLGPIDVLVNNAGVYPRQSFMEMSEQQWDDMQSINLKSMFHLTQATFPDMIARRSGKIVNISSVTFHLGMANLTHYVASKGGVIGLTRSLAREAGPHNVHVNCVTPGAIQVEAEKLFVTKEQIAAWLELQSLKRRILPVDIARVCLFLASELSEGMTGQTLNVDGGWVMH